MSDILIISGSPQEQSRTDAVLQYFGTLLEENDFDVSHVSVQNLPAEDLMLGRFDSPVVTQIGEKVQTADGVIIGSPIYKASYAGVLKALLDLLPQNALKDTPVLPIMTGGTITHCLAIEYTLKPLIATLKGQNEQGVFVIDKLIDKYSREDPVKDFEMKQRLTKALGNFILRVGQRNPSRV